MISSVDVCLLDHEIEGVAFGGSPRALILGRHYILLENVAGKIAEIHWFVALDCAGYCSRPRWLSGRLDGEKRPRWAEDLLGDVSRAHDRSRKRGSGLQKRGFRYQFWVVRLRSNRRSRSGCYKSLAKDVTPINALSGRRKSAPDVV